jgi:glycosyltransferase involved in cell wall biosynthesis
VRERLLDDLLGANGDPPRRAEGASLGAPGEVLRYPGNGAGGVKIAMVGLKGIPARYGGVERHVEELGARLAARGHDVTAYCRRHYTPEGVSCRGVSLRILPSISTKRLDTISHTLLAMADLFPKRFDIVHVHSVGPAALTCIPRLLKRRTKVVVTAHGLDWQRRKWGAFARAFLRLGGWAATTFPHRTIVVSRAMQRHFAERGKETVYIPNGVEAPAPTPLNALRRFGIEPGKYVLWMGRFVPEKRVEDLIAAFRSVASDHRLLLAGELNESDGYLRRLRETAKGDPRIIFSGGLYGIEKAEALTNAALAVLPSDLEGFPIALLEAMRYGRPVIASDIPENLEAVTPDVNGLTYAVGDVPALAERLTWALEHPDALRALAQRAEQDAMQFDWDRIASQVEAVYRELLPH